MINERRTVYLICLMLLSFLSIVTMLIKMSVFFIRYSLQVLDSLACLYFFIKT